MMDPGEGLAEEYEYEVIPVPIQIGDKTYKDGIDISPKMVMEAGKKKENFPKTSQIPIGVYKDTFEKHLKNGDDVFYLALSSGLSGTFQAANLAAEELREKYPDRVIKVVDSKGATMSMAMLLQQALKLDRLGKDIDEIEETVKFLADHINVFFMVGDLKWLAKGGRLSKSSAALGNLLNIVPIIYINDGKLEVFDKIRGKKKAYKKLEEMMKNALKDVDNQTVGIIDANNPDFTRKMKRAVSRVDCANVMLPEKGVGSALTVHVGDDLFGFGYFDELPENYVNVNP